MKKFILYISTLVFALNTSFTVNAEDNKEEQIIVQPVAGNIYMLEGPGGNIGVLATEQGLLLIDDKFAPLAEKIEQAMKGIVDKDLKYVVNTHYHGDHTGSNEHFAKHAPIFAHENVRVRLNNNEKVAKSALPVVTYKDGVTIYLAEEEVQIKHLAHGHTDSDSIVYFPKTNVLHTGDLFFEMRFPYIDLEGGGSIDGYLANVSYMITTFPDDVVIIPGHGNITNKEALKAFAQMIQYSIDRVSQAMKAGKTDEEILAMGIGEQYQHLSWHFITEERWLNTMIKGLKK